MLQQAAISRLDNASPSDHKFLQDWLDHPDGGKLFLRGRETDPWRDEHFKDLVCLSRRRGEENILAQILIKRAVPCFHHYFGHLVKVALPLVYKCG